MVAASWALAVFGAFCLVLTGAAMLLGARPVIVRTGSMTPELPIGTVALVRSVPASQARVGDVAAVIRSDGRRIMHRVIRTRPAGGESATIVLRGDANRSADPRIAVAEHPATATQRPVRGAP